MIFKKVCTNYQRIHGTIVFSKGTLLEENSECKSIGEVAW